MNNMRVRDPVRVFGAGALVAAFMTLAGCASYPRNITEGMTHDELLARGGYYADLYQKQLLEEELERA